jgi:hypothetical protein
MVNGGDVPASTNTTLNDFLELCEPWFKAPPLCQIESVSPAERRQDSSETDRKCTEERDKLRTDVMAAWGLTFPLSRRR